MLYVLHGTDIEKAREKSHALFEALKAKKPDAAAGTIASEEITLEKLEELTQTQGLFENKQIIFMDRTLENKDVREVMLDKIDAIAESPNIFIFFEGKLTKEVLKKLEKRAEKITEYEAAEGSAGFGAGGAKKEGSFFVLADALGARDKKRLWSLLREALDNDAAPEEIHGILFWQAKSLALAADAPSAAATGLNQFVFSKAKRYATEWKREEIDALLSKLVAMYHRAHRGEASFEVELEKLALDI